MYQAALVLEGGALRGQYTAGILDAFLDHGIFFHTVIGVSAGALCGTNYISQQRGRTDIVNTRYRHDKDYISLRRAFHRQDIINLDYLFAEHGGRWEPFDEVAYRTSPMTFVVAATALEKGRAVYFHHPQGRDLIADLKASSAMPFISKPVYTGLGLCLDGGVADSIPYAYAQANGFDKIVVIRTRPRAYRKNPTSPVLARAYQRTFSDYPAFVQAAIARPQMYNHQAQTLQSLEGEGQVFVLAPKAPVTVKRLESDVSKLEALYQTGLADGAASLPQLKAYLNA
ncbi:patatin family protein [Lacticaseibacillus baoqingensis]|uniref:Patatin family protein n=1 Tax=Lacticaseibacillus baoqingensis TaxID=2486013 RepID=A0ABW4EB26_9LACO|nr:patatin family protein [Lacticaseibacillus baoqingensis]